MRLTITDELMTGEHTAHSARLVRYQAGDAWQVSWLPGQIMDRNAATTAMVIAETAASEPVTHSCPKLLLTALAAELGLTADEALRRCAASPEASAEPGTPHTRQPLAQLPPPAAGALDSDPGERVTGDRSKPAQAGSVSPTAVVRGLEPVEAAELTSTLWRGYERAHDQARAAYGTPGYLRQAEMAADLGRLWTEESRAASAALMRGPAEPDVPALDQPGRAGGPRMQAEANQNALDPGGQRQPSRDGGTDCRGLNVTVREGHPAVRPTGESREREHGGPGCENVATNATRPPPPDREAGQ